MLLGGLSQGKMSGWSDGVWVVGMVGFGGLTDGGATEARDVADGVVEGAEVGDKVGALLGVVDGIAEGEQVGGGRACIGLGWGGFDE